MKSITEKLTDIVGTAFESCDLSREMGFVRVADRPDLAQFQCNGAMAAAKAAKKNPREVAQAVVDYLKNDKTFSKLEIAGPGFINLNVTDEYLAAHMVEAAGDDHLGVTAVKPDTVVLDYGGPNIAKPMHVGHLRAAIIGDSLRRIMAFAGYKTLGDVHMGDWGTHMGMIVSEYIRRSNNANNTPTITALVPVTSNWGQSQSSFFTIQSSPNLMDDLSVMYPLVSAACKEDEERKAEALDATVKIQNKEPQYYNLWKKIRDESIIGMKANYELLDVHFNLWKGESDVHDLIPPMVDDLKMRGFAMEDDGAVIVPVKKNDDKKEFPPLILYKRDGAVMYGTTDLATIVERMRDYKPVKIIYVVDQRQHLHFEQVFRAARLSGIAPADIELTHAGFGTMNGADGKPFKTRAGGVMRLEDLIAMGLEKARARMEEAEIAKDFSATEKEDVAHKVAIAAIKFADLQNQRHADYVFDLDRLTSFEGKTGPYLLYQAVRIKSLLRKADYLIGKTANQLIIQDEDRPLALLLTQFPDAFDAALNNYAPHHLCDYAYKLAQEFSRFYSSCHILSEENEALKSSRLALCALTVRTMETALGLLGISVPERM